MKTKIEYTIIGQDVEEHFDTYNEAENYLFENFTKDEQMEVQFFSKEWAKNRKTWNEGDVEIIKNFGELL